MNWINRIRERKMREKALAIANGEIKDAEAVRLYLLGEYDKAFLLKKEQEERIAKLERARYLDFGTRRCYTDDEILNALEYLDAQAKE